MPGSTAAAMIYRDTFLPFSETFVRDHILGLRRFEAIPVGGQVLRDGLSLPGTVVTELNGNRRLRRPIDPVLRVMSDGSMVRSRRLARLVATVRPSVLHAHFGPDGAIARPGAVRHGVPLIVTFHGYDVTRIATQDESRARSPYGRMLREWDALLRDSAAIITVSKFLARKLEARGADPAKLRIIPCGVDPAKFTYTDAPPEGPLVFIGRLVEKKGVADLITALSTVPSAPPLIVLGDGPLRGSLEELSARLRVDVAFSGAADSAQVATTMRAARAVIMPSRTALDGDAEGLGVVALEAQASGRPIIGYAHGGLPEAVESGVSGLLVDEGDVAGLASQIEYLLRSPHLALAMGRSARDRVEVLFRADRLLARVEDVYDAVAAETTEAASRISI